MDGRMWRMLPECRSSAVWARLSFADADLVFGQSFRAKRSACYDAFALIRSAWHGWVGSSARAIEIIYREDAGYGFDQTHRSCSGRGGSRDGRRAARIFSTNGRTGNREIL